MQTKLKKIIQLVIPNEHIKSIIVRPEPTNTELTQNTCFENLLSLFNEKCTVQDTVSILKPLQIYKPAV